MKHIHFLMSYYWFFRSAFLFSSSYKNWRIKSYFQSSKKPYMISECKTIFGSVYYKWNILQSGGQIYDSKYKLCRTNGFALCRWARVIWHDLHCHKHFVGECILELYHQTFSLLTLWGFQNTILKSKWNIPIRFDRTSFRKQSTPHWSEKPLRWNHEFVSY